MTFARRRNAETLEKARNLRQSGSIIEKTLWRVLRQQAKLQGLKFRYQHPVDPYIVDFVCISAQLIVEIDGMSHDSTLVYDAKRECYLKAKGFAIVRFSNGDVMRNAAGVAIAICEQAHRLQQILWSKETPPRT